MSNEFLPHGLLQLLGVPLDIMSTFREKNHNGWSIVNDHHRRRLYHRIDGVIHHDTGPANIIYLNGSLILRFLKDGKNHREDGPALIWFLPDFSVQLVREAMNIELGYTGKLPEGICQLAYLRNDNLYEGDGPSLIDETSFFYKDKSYLPLPKPERLLIEKKLNISYRLKELKDGDGHE